MCVQDMAFGFKFTEIRNVPDRAGCHAAAFHVGRHLLQHTLCLGYEVDQVSSGMQPLDVSAWPCERQKGTLKLVIDASSVCAVHQSCAITV